jgi:iron complex transport system substrate-binding protein
VPTSADHSPQRIVCLQPSATVILQLLGQLRKVVACTKYCLAVCPEVGDGDRYIVADSWLAHTEEILAARPDMVVASVPYQERSVIEILRAGRRFLGFAPRTLADIYGDIALLGGTVGATPRAEQIIAAMQRVVTATRACVEGKPRLRVYCEEWGKPLIASQPWVAELIAAAGGEFIGEPGLQTTAETVLAADPDVIIAAWCGAGDRVPLRKIVRDRNWETMRAVQNGRVFCIRDEYLNTPAPTVLQGLEALAAAIHPEVFPQPADLRCIADEPSHEDSPQEAMAS